MAMEPLWGQSHWTRDGGGAAGRYGIGQVGQAGGLGVGMGGMTRGNGTRGMMTGFNHGNNNETPPPGQGG